jgi:hypothetical protein
LPFERKIMKCEKNNQLLEILMSTDVDPKEARGVLRHTKMCESCRELLTVHQRLEMAELPDPPNADLLEVRRGVLRNLRTGHLRTGRPRAGDATDDRTRFWNWLELPMMKPVFGVLATVALLAIGFVAGRTGIQESALGADAIAGSISQAAAANLRLSQSQESPYAYSNVRLQDVGDGTVRLGFDVATHLDLVRSKDDPLVAEVLVQSLVNPASVGTRLEAIDLVGSLQPKVRDALVVAMLDDQNLAVRLKAISKLTADGTDAATQDALLEVLRQEPSVTMRLLAIDHLTNHDVSAAALRTALEQGRPEPGTAVYAKAEEYLRVF